MEERIHESWEELLAAGLEAREMKDTGQWKLGDIALQISVDYGDNTIGKYAYGIGVEKKTLMNYRTIASRFTPEIRERYRKLSFSHFALLGAVQEPEAWLEKADDHDWSVEGLRQELNKVYAEVKGIDVEDEIPEVYRCPDCNLWRLKDQSSFDICRGHYKLGKGKLQYV